MLNLATTDDLVAELGRPLTAAEAAKAPGLLASASTRIRGYCRREFTIAANGVVELRPIGSQIRLPNTPVTSVNQVEQIGTAGTPDRVMGVTEWAFDGINLIELWPAPCLNDWPTTAGSYANTYRVTYGGGGTVPVFIVGKTVEVVLRHLLTPTQVVGLVQERIGQYAYQYGQGPGQQSPGAAVRLTREDKDELAEAGYRPKAGTIQLRVS